MQKKDNRQQGITRRDFIKGTTAATVALGIPFITRHADARPIKQELVIAWDASGTAGWDFHKVTQKTQERGASCTCYNSLIEFDRRKVDLNLLMPALASDWDISEDGLEWTFKLLEGVRWHDNYGVEWGELTAEDIEYSIKRSLSFGGKQQFSSVKDFKILDKYTLKMMMQTPQSQIDVMAMVAKTPQCFIASKKAIEKLGDDFNLKPVGTGFFKLDKYVPNTYSEWVPHERHWRGRPMLDRVRHMYMKDLSSREMAFQKGEAHMIQGLVSQRWYESASKLKDADPVLVGPGSIMVLHFNTSREPFKDKRLREAVMHAIDRETLEKFIGKNITRRQISPLHRDYMGYTEDVKRYDYNPDKVKELLEKAGSPKGFEVEMKISEIDDYLTPMQVVQGMLKKVGITLKLNVVTHSAYHKLIRQDVNPLVIYGCDRFPTGQQLLEQFYHSKSIVGTPKAVTNFSHYNGIDKELDTADTEVDVNKKIQLWQEAQKKIMEDAVAYPMYIYQRCWVKKKWVDLGYHFESNLEYSPLLSEKTRILAH